MHNLLILSAGTKIRLVKNFLRELEELPFKVKVHVVDTSPLPQLDSLPVKIHKLKSSFWNSAQSFRDFYFEHDISLVLPTRNGELLFLREVTEKFPQLNGVVAVSETSFLRNSLDKISLSNSGFFDSSYFLPAFSDYRKLQTKRAVIKERFGAGSRNLIRCNTSKIPLQEVSEFEAPIYQDFYAGREFSVDVYMNRSCKSHAISMRFRDEIENGECIQSTFFEDNEVRDAIIKVLSNRGARGPINVQGILDSHGNFKFFDINPRIGGAYFMSRYGGFTLTKWLIQEYGLNEEPTEFHSTDFRGRVARTANGYEKIKHFDI